MIISLVMKILHQNSPTTYKGNLNLIKLWGRCSNSNNVKASRVQVNGYDLTRIKSNQTASKWGIGFWCWSRQRIINLYTFLYPHFLGRSKRKCPCILKVYRSTMMVGWLSILSYMAVVSILYNDIVIVWNQKFPYILDTLIRGNT